MGFVTSKSPHKKFILKSQSDELFYFPSKQMFKMVMTVNIFTSTILQSWNCKTRKKFPHRFPHLFFISNLRVGRYICVQVPMEVRSVGSLELLQAAVSRPLWVLRTGFRSSDAQYGMLTPSIFPDFFAGKIIFFSYRGRSYFRGFLLSPGSRERPPPMMLVPWCKNHIFI